MDSKPKGDEPNSFESPSALTTFERHRCDGVSGPQGTLAAAVAVNERKAYAAMMGGAISPARVATTAAGRFHAGRASAPWGFTGR